MFVKGQGVARIILLCDHLSPFNLLVEHNTVSFCYCFMLQNLVFCKLLKISSQRPEFTCVCGSNNSSKSTKDNCENLDKIIEIIEHVFFPSCKLSTY